MSTNHCSDFVREEWRTHNSNTLVCLSLQLETRTNDKVVTSNFAPSNPVLFWPFGTILYLWQDWSAKQLYVWQDWSPSNCGVALVQKYEPSGDTKHRAKCLQRFLLAPDTPMYPKRILPWLLCWEIDWGGNRSSRYACIHHTTCLKRPLKQAAFDETNYTKPRDT